MSARDDKPIGSADERKAAAGEPMVWLSGMGLALGLLLIIGLLGIIVRNGIPYFWPKRVAEVTLVQGAEIAGIGGQKFSGELRMQRTKRDSGTEESQFYLGNRDIYGFSFKFVDDSQIAELSYPEGLISVEREEYGRAIGYPIKLVLADGSELAASDEEFDTRLEAIIDEVSDRRAEIKHIAKGKIGKINRKIDALKFKEIEARKKYGDPSDELGAALEEIETERARLGERYEVLESELNELYELQEKAT